MGKTVGKERSATRLGVSTADCSTKRLQQSENLSVLKTWRLRLNFTNLVQVENFRKLGHFINEDILQTLINRSRFLEFIPCTELVKLSNRCTVE